MSNRPVFWRVNEEYENFLFVSAAVSRSQATYHHIPKISENFHLESIDLNIQEAGIYRGANLPMGCSVVL